jgi:Domain of unknown function (DUF6249)
MNLESLIMNLETALDSLIPLLIPIVGIVFGIGCAMFAMYLDFRKKQELIQLHHAERMAAIEKGIELPPLPPELLSGRYSRSSSSGPAGRRRSGLILLFVGIAITIGLWGGGGAGNGGFWWGLVPTLLGLALLLAGTLEARELRQSNASDQGARSHE